MTSTLEVRDNGIIGQAIRYNWFKAHKDNISHYTTRKGDKPLDYTLKVQGLIQLKLNQGDRIILMYDDYSIWLHGALIMIRKR